MNHMKAVDSLASAIFVVRPAAFTFNPETEASNKFQQAPDSPAPDVQASALSEFDTFVKILRANDIEVACLSDTLHPATPDSIFPNNWVTFHEGGRVVLYPMQAQNRRLETKKGFLRSLVDGFGVEFTSILDLRYYAEEGKYLEGTGSMVFDHINRVAWVCLSNRSYPEPLEEVCHFLGYTSLPFRAMDVSGFPIYHTNVMMSVGEDYAIICEEAVHEADRMRVMDTLRSIREHIISITHEQMAAFAGNILQIRNKKGDKVLLMSKSAYESFDEDQRKTLGEESILLTVAIPTIEGIGGGSIRCMVAELF